MTKAMIMEIIYHGYYGGDVHEMTILPIEMNDVFFERQKEGCFEESVSLGEIEGKHSDCYGDLTVSFVDLDEYRSEHGSMELSKLIDRSVFSHIESYIESIAEDFEEYDEEKSLDLHKKFGVERKSWDNEYGIYEKFIEQLKEKYFESYKEIIIEEKDYDTVVKLVKEAGISVYK